MNRTEMMFALAEISRSLEEISIVIAALRDCAFDNVVEKLEKSCATIARHRTTLSRCLLLSDVKDATDENPSRDPEQTVSEQELHELRHALQSGLFDGLFEDLSHFETGGGSRATLEHDADEDMELFRMNSKQLRELLNMPAIEKLKEVIEFEDGVEEFLADRSQTVKLLGEAIEKLKEYFPADSEYYLEKSPNPDDDVVLLGVYVSLPVDEALDLLHKFDTEWWLDRKRNVANPGLLIDVHCKG